REKQKGSRGIRRGQRYRLVFQFPIREQLSLLRLLAGKFPHEIRMLRALFNENDNHCQLIAHIFFIHD
ncbi:hypothetical protein OU623_00125, partial [Escherichia coli]|nr:hypothetical protein [Escherichia coli]